MSKVKDLAKQKFGKLTVIKRVENDKQGNTQWLCQCDCYGENSLKIIRSVSLRNGDTKSCGCLQKETIREVSQTNKKYNTYDLTGNYGIGYTYKSEEFYFDLEDYDKIKDYCWHINKDDYVVTGLNNRNIFMHRIIMNCPSNMEVDHKFHDNFDCRKEFLRIVTPSQNQMNRGIHKNNTSGVKGVSWHKDKEKWRSYISINKKCTQLGYFDNFEEAVNVRKIAEEKYYGEYRLKEKNN